MRFIAGWGCDYRIRVIDEADSRSVRRSNETHGDSPDSHTSRRFTESAVFLPPITQGVTDSTCDPPEKNV